MKYIGYFVSGEATVKIPVFMLLLLKFSFIDFDSFSKTSFDFHLNCQKTKSHFEIDPSKTAFIIFGVSHKKGYKLTK